MISFKEFISESIEDRGIMKAIFIIGIPGSGKSYTASKLSGRISPRIVNTDKATEYLVKKFKKISTPDNWFEFKDTTHRVTTSSLTNYVNGLLPLFVDGTSNDASNILHRAGLLESLGYDVGMVFIETSLETAVARVNARVKDTGRTVSDSFIKMVAQEAEDNKNYFKSKFHFFKTVKNDNGELTDEVLLDAFKSVEKFFEAPLENPVGKRHLAELKEKRGKYLEDIMPKEVIAKKIEGWYKS